MGKVAPNFQELHDWLMKRLGDDICFSKISYGLIEKHTAMQNDIVRLRRELLALSKMLDP